MLLLSPLTAYEFTAYENKKSDSDGDANGFTVATRGLNDTHFKIYAEVRLSNPIDACLILAFGALTKYTWTDADILAISVSKNAPYVKLIDLGGDSGTYSVKGGETQNDWQLLKTGSDPSVIYSQGIWRLEAVRAYARNEYGFDADIKSAESSGSTTVAVNLFKNACPTASYSYTFAMVGEVYFYDLKPTKRVAYILAFCSTLILSLLL